MDDQAILSRLGELRKDAVQLDNRPGDACWIRKEWARGKGLIVVPGEESIRNHIPSLAKTLIQRNVKHVFGSEVFGYENIPPYVELQVDLGTLYDFEQKYVVVPFALTPIDESFLILLTNEDYYLVAGDREFIEGVFGQPIESQLSAYKDYATDPRQPMLMEVYERYSEMV